MEMNINTSLSDFYQEFLGYDINKVFLSIQLYRFLTAYGCVLKKNEDGSYSLYESDNTESFRFTIKDKYIIEVKYDDIYKTFDVSSSCVSEFENLIEFIRS